MVDTIKVYEIVLQPHESFIFYRHEGKLVNTNSLAYPAPIEPAQIWSASTNSFVQYVPINNAWTTRIIIPIIGVSCEDLSEYITVRGLEIAKLIDKGVYVNHNIVVATKTMETNFLAVGLAIVDVITDRRNYKAEEAINRFFRLKAFW